MRGLAFLVVLLYWLRISLALLVLRCEIYWPLRYYLRTDACASCTFPSLEESSLAILMALLYSGVAKVLEDLPPCRSTGKQSLMSSRKRNSDFTAPYRNSYLAFQSSHTSHQQPPTPTPPHLCPSLTLQVLQIWSQKAQALETGRGSK